MKNNTFIKLMGSAVSVAVLATMASFTQAQPSTLDELLKVVEEGRYAESKENKQREARFRAQKAQQEKLLSDAKKERSRLEKLAELREKQLYAV